MQFFRVVVNGKSYNVEIDEISQDTGAKEKNGRGAGAPVGPQLSVVPANRKGPVKEPVTEPVKEPVKESLKETPSKGGVNGQIMAPMPGIVWEIVKAAGDSVAAGETIMLLEAMKLENDIVALKDGVITMLHVSKGQSVNAGDLLAEIE